MSRSVTDPRLTFHAVYYEVHSELEQNYLVLFFHQDRSVELIDERTTRTVLKRTPCANLSTEQFFLGASIVVFGKVLKLLSYGDVVTEQLCEKTSEATCVVFHEDAFPKLGTFLDIITQECSFGVSAMQTVSLPTLQAAEAVPEVAAGLKLLPSRYLNRRAVVVRIIRDSAIQRGAQLPARLGAPQSVWVSTTKAEVEGASILFALPNAVDVNSSSDTAVAIIKPHVLRGNRGGEALHLLLSANAGISLQAISQVTLSSMQADSFFRPYKGVLAEYRGCVEQLCAGTMWAVQVKSAPGYGGGELIAVKALREACGPYDPAIAKVIRPATIRARLGLDVAHNGIHCSDCVEDAATEAKQLFLSQW